MAHECFAEQPLRLTLCLPESLSCLDRVFAWPQRFDQLVHRRRRALEDEVGDQATRRALTGMVPIGAADPESTEQAHHDLRRAVVTGCLQGAFNGLTLQSVRCLACWSDLGKADAARTAEQV